MAFSINVLSLRYFLALTILFFIKLYHDVGPSYPDRPLWTRRLTLSSLRPFKPIDWRVLRLP